MCTGEEFIGLILFNFQPGNNNVGVYLLVNILFLTKIPDTKKAKALLDNAVRKYAVNTTIRRVMAYVEVFLNVLGGRTFTLELEHGLEPI